MNLEEAYYDLKFENAFLRTKGNEFQTFFERLMGLAYKADFMACRPWGNVGDRKNDGFLKTEKRLFQVYAPNEMTAKKAIDKITEDFEGAKVHWKKYFDKWSFVHNATKGLPPHALELILEFERANPAITIEPWGLEELRLVLRRLSPEDLAQWFGPAPTEEAKTKLGFEDLRIVLESLEGKTVRPGAPVKIVPFGKIGANDLSERTATLIKSGMTKTPLVSDFLDSWHDETLGDRLAGAFHAKYDLLRGTRHPNQIFSEFQAWVGGELRGTAEHEMAVLAVLAYFFERCDFLEEPKDTQA